MRKPPSRHPSLQLHFFRPRPQTPRWDRLPADVRRKTLPLIASLLRSTMHAMREANDER